ncbi:MAG TPA: rRNA maturation RNase YbeY [Casimicrobiaceae bacterium]|jgi:probable rRNA maturation factor|nr:rRNA maturation RNase YbeY [Casimicrobiaceae bacterium]
MKRRRARLALNVQYAVSGDDLPKPAALRRWGRAALTRNARITLRFVGEAEGRALNRRYRRRDRATNVLAFVYHEGRGTHGIEGDVVLCVPVLRREAGEQGKLVAAHSAHLVVHAMLHLQGYNHAGAADAARMEARERSILARLGFPDPYAAPASKRPRRDSQ